MEPESITALEIAKIATDIEDSGMRFYGAAAEQADNEEARQLFQGLRSAELDHMNRFRKMYANIESMSGGTDSHAEMLFAPEMTSYLQAATRGAVFPDEEAARQWVAKAPGVESILERALEAEKSSVLLYTEMADHAAFEDSRDILREIIREEKRHAAMISDMLRKLG